MKKTSKSSSFNRRAALTVPLLLLAVVAAWGASTLRADVTGQNTLSMADRRHVENVQCSGACDNVLLVDDQAPGTRFFAGGDCPTCIEANIWAGQTREGQITINGYAFYDGVQANLAPKTFGTEVLDGRDISWTLPRLLSTDSSATSVDPTFTVHLKDTGDENMVDSVEFAPVNGSSSDNITIVTDHASGRDIAFDACTQANKDTKIYTLYQSPELHGPNTTNSYDVSIDRRESLESGTITGGTNVFTQTLFGHDLENRNIERDSVHITADVGDATFDFDLVRD